jgi:hypothetical protein
MVETRDRVRRKARMSIPSGIEKAIYKASIDPGFRQELLEDGRRAIESHGLGLTDMEARILESIPGERLEHIIDRIEPRRHGKRAFMKSIATAVVTLATGTATVSCLPLCGGATSDYDFSMDDPPRDIRPDDRLDLEEDIPGDTDHDLEVTDAPDDVPLDDEDAEQDVEEDIEEED